jgi:tRNA uridine 5-carbamoylmethylation protein Kti12
MNKKMKYIVLVGPPCCGKSTWCENFMDKNPNTIIVSRDAILMEFAKEIDETMTYNTAWGRVSQKEVDKEYKKRLKESCAYSDNNIIVDATNMGSKRRIINMKGVSDEYDREAIVFLWDKKTFIERNTKRLAETGKGISVGIWQTMVNNYKTPIKEEGFDKITFLTNN